MPDPISLIADPLTLPNGIRVPNRLVKVRSTVAQAFFESNLRRRLLWQKASVWAEDLLSRIIYGCMGNGPKAGGGWSSRVSFRHMVRVTSHTAQGNVQIDPKHLASPHDLTITPSTADRVAFRRLASVVASNPKPPLLIMQISHPGLQSSSTVNFSRLPHQRAIGPCSARPDMNGGIMGWLWGHAVWPRKSKEIRDPEDWLSIVDRFVAGAVLAEEAGWDGIQVHAAHGYLLAEYLSPLVSHYTPMLSETATDRH